MWERARGSPWGLVGMEIPHWSGLENDWLRRQEQCPGRREGRRAGSFQEEGEVFKLEDKAGGKNWDHKGLGLSWWLAGGGGLQGEAAIPPPGFLGTECQTVQKPGRVQKEEFVSQQGNTEMGPCRWGESSLPA